MAIENGKNTYNRYGQPSLDLVFTGPKKSLVDRVGNQQVEFTRNTIGTYIDENGIIKTAVADEARFDHDPVTGESLGLLIEESRTNLLQYSEQFDQSAWIKAQATVTPNIVTAPDGTQTADKLVMPISASTFHLCKQTATVSAGTFTASIYAKKADFDWFLFKQDSGSAAGSAYRGAWFNLNTGSVGTVDSGLTANIEGAENGWYRCSIKYILTGSGTSNIAAIISPGDGQQNIVGDGTSGVYLWGAQVEEGSFPTSYIPTTSSTVTRAADVATVSNANNVAYPSTNTLVQRPFGASAIGLPSLSITAGNTVKRISVYPGTLSQLQINGAAEKTDEFWRWRILGSSFALPTFTTDGQVTVDWGDGTIEVLTTGEHTFTNGGGYHEIGFRLDSGTYFRPIMAANATHKDKVVAVGPAPESMIVDGTQAWWGCTNLISVDATFKLTLANSTFYLCSGLKNIPMIDTSGASNFSNFARGCNSLTSFPLIDTSSGTNFNSAFWDCSSLTSFPLIDTSSGTDFYGIFFNCAGLTSLPLIDTSNGIDFSDFCKGTTITTFPSYDFSSATKFLDAWYNCSNLTDFPPNMFDTTGTLITNAFRQAWQYTALSVQSVENILVSLDTNGASNITLSLIGGTNAAKTTWTAAANTAYDNLIVKGWDIAFNA